MDRDFKGIWIPKEIWLSKDLTLQEKLFLVEIDSLDNEEGCFASNSYFSEFFDISKTRVSLVIKSLIDKGYITSLIIYKEGTKEILKRVLNVCYRGYETKVKEPTQQKLKENNKLNKSINNTVNNLIKYLDYVYLTQEEYNKLIQELGQLNTQDYIERLNDYIMQIGEAAANKKYKSHYAVIKNWSRRDKPKTNQPKPQPPKQVPNQGEKRQYNVDDLEKQLLGRG